jgi:hypothetical protein
VQRDGPESQAPVADVEVTVLKGLATQGARSDAAGLFHLRLLPKVKRGQVVTLRFQHPDYRPLILTTPVGDKLYIARMTPLVPSTAVAVAGPRLSITNLTVRYTLRSTMTESIGTAVRAFEAKNVGNVPCAASPDCSPDGKWKAAVASVTLDAGEGNAFRRPRVTCIAGPCPFTRIESDKVSENGRWIDVSVRAWSDTATFLLQAEVVRTMNEETVRRLYPVIFGNGLNFTLPAEAEGPSIEADVDGTSVVFPLGPQLCLSWADCRVRSEQDQTKVYRCELKPDYQFR